MSNYFDKDGNPLELHEWSKLHSDFDYKLIAHEIVGDRRVSTVWLGINHSFGGDNTPPLIFETMIFVGDGWLEIYCDRYSTLEEAGAGHKKAVALAPALEIPNWFEEENISEVKYDDPNPEDTK